MTNMRLLITGGAGCLGSNIVERYLDQGHQILVIDNLATGKRNFLPTRDSLIVTEGSIADRELVRKTFDSFRPTHVIHSAASYKDPENWAEDASTNVLGTIHVAKEALKHSVERFINLQTALCYGRPTRIPIPVDHPTAPFTSYGISKTAGEAYLMQSALPVVSLRLANICGPRLAIGPIPTFYKRLKAGQSCFCSDTIRDFLDISDFFTLMDAVLVKGAPVGVFNVSTGEGHRILDVYHAVAVHLGISPPEVPVLPVGNGDVQQVVLDPSVTISTFGWRAAFDFEDTIANQLRLYDRFGVDNIYSHLGSPIDQKRENRCQ